MTTFGISKKTGYNTKMLLWKKHKPSRNHVEIMFAFLKFHEQY